jgi:hypothetical protein
MRNGKDFFIRFIPLLRRPSDQIYLTKQCFCGLRRPVFRQLRQAGPEDWMETGGGCSLVGGEFSVLENNG